MHARPWLHLLPHTPQLLTSVPVATSQPLTAFPSQSETPWSHAVRMQAALEQATLECGYPGQGMAQPPQFLRSLRTEVSQPSMGSPLQSSNPNLHAAM